MALYLFNSINDLLDNIANRKKRRYLATDPLNQELEEKTSLVYQNACEFIGNEISSYGFRYVNSAKLLKQNSGDFEFHISFSSSQNNVRGEYISLCISVQIKSKKLAAFRKAQFNPFRNDDLVAGGFAHLIEDKHAFIEWNLADKTTRQETINNICDFIKTVVIPYLNEFKDSENIFNKISKDQIKAFSIENKIEYLMCFFSRADAQRFISSFIAQRPELKPEVLREIDRIQSSGKIEPFTFKQSTNIAKAVLYYHFSLE